MNIILISAFLEDEVYNHILDDEFMDSVICKEDHFYHRIAKSLSLKGYNPTMVYLSTQKSKKEFTHKYGHKIIRYPVKKIPFLHEPIIFSEGLIDEIIKNYDLCFIVSGYYVFYKIPDMFDYIVFRIHKKIPIIARWAGGDHRWLFPIRKNIKIKSLKMCNKIICAGKEERDILKKKFKINPQNIVSINNPIDGELFKKRSKKYVCSRLNLNENNKYFLYVGRLIHNKGIEELLETFKNFTNLNKDLILILIGEGPLKNYILEYIEKNFIKDKVILTGRLEHEQICYYYNVASVLFHIGTSGGMPNAILEAISSGLPIIASRNGANSDLVNEEMKTGIIIEPGNKIELKNAIETILSNEKNEENFSLIENNSYFSFERYGEEILKIYDEIKNSK